MKIRNINPLGAVTVRDLDFRVVDAGEVIEVDDELGARMLEQTDNWAGSSKGAREITKEVKAEEKAAAESPDDEAGETNG